MILAGDIGGTNTRLSFVNITDSIELQIVEVFPSQRYRGLEEIVREFAAKQGGPIRYACFGVAGPVKKRRCKTPNLPWIIDADHLESSLNIHSVDLINDLEANAYGITVLEPGDFFTLHEGIPDPDGTAVLVSPGTGLGEAGLHKVNERYIPVPSEGGHCSFAPRNELEIDLLRYLSRKYEHVSFERVVSGPGLYNIYTFLRDTGRGEEETWLSRQINDVKDPVPVISNAALQHKCPLCERALELFVSLFGAEAGNMALKFKATGGVYLGGGIAPKIIDKLRDKTFMESFVSKGRMRSLMEQIPVRIILNDQTALLGAAHKAKLNQFGT